MSASLTHHWFRGLWLRVVGMGAPEPTRPSQPNAIEWTQSAIEAAIACEQVAESALADADHRRLPYSDMAALLLYREAVRCTSLTVGKKEDSEAAPLRRFSRQELLTVVESDDELTELEEALSATPEQWLSRPKEDRIRITKAIRQLSRALLKPRIAAKRARGKKTWLRVAVVVMVVGALGGAYPLLSHKPNLAANKPWRASSALATCLAVSEGGCWADGRPGVFFHTKQEDKPWLEIDLGKVQRVSEIEVHNARDCCAERAYPLVVEVSEDGKSWQEVARRDEGFDVWTKSFRATKAQFVRLTVQKKTYFHLESVQVRR